VLSGGDVVDYWWKTILGTGSWEQEGARSLVRCGGSYALAMSVRVRIRTGMRGAYEVGGSVVKSDEWMA